MNHDFPVALSDNGPILKPSAKSDTIECIGNSFSEENCPPKVDAITVDGPAHVHMHPRPPPQEEQKPTAATVMRLSRQ